VGLSLTVEHRRGHGALYDAVNAGAIAVSRLRQALAGVDLPRQPDGQLMLAVDVSAWLRPNADTAPDRAHCHVRGRGHGEKNQTAPGWPYSFVVALEPGRHSWVAVLDVLRLAPLDDVTAVTATQVRDLVERLRDGGRWQPGDPPILVLFDAGYDLTRLTWLLTGLPVIVIG
ncbi:transposase, partial [Actinoplanes campanulatus]